MNDIQSLPAEKHGHLFVSFNPLTPPSPKRVLAQSAFARPMLSGDGVCRAPPRRAYARAVSSGRYRVDQIRVPR